MAQQLLNRWEWQRLPIQSIGCWIKRRLGKGMTQIVWTQRRRKLCCLAELRNDFTDAPFVQGTALTEKEMPIRPGTPRSHRFSSFHRPFSPVFCQVFAVVEIGIERFACFLDERDLAMFERLCAKA